MPRTRNPYPAEFREQIVALAHSERSVEDLAREFEPCAATIHGWIKQSDLDWRCCEGADFRGEMGKHCADRYDRRALMRLT